MANYSNFLRLSNGIATNTDLLTDRLLVLNPIVDGYAAFKGGSNYTNLQASASTTNYTFTLPPNGGLSSQFLQTDGSGVTQWAAVSLSPTLQEVYDNDPNGGNAVISTTATDGSVEIAGSESLYVSAAGGLVVNTTGAMSVTSTQPSGIRVSLGGVDPRHLYTTDNAVNDASASETLVIATGDKTDGTGNSGDLILETGTSVGGARGRIVFAADRVGTLDVTDNAGPSLQVTISSGDNLDVGGTGDLNLRTGDQQDSSTNSSGAVNINSGHVNGGTAGNTGSVVMGSGFVVAGTGDSGSATFYTGETFGGGTSGAMTIYTGGALGGGNTGSLTLNTGMAISAGSSGAINLMTGASDSANSGNINIVTGAPTTSGSSGSIGLSTSPSASGPNGNIDLSVGQGFTNGGSITISSGEGLAGTGGQLNITAGNGTTTGGTVSINSGDGATPGRIDLNSNTVRLRSTFDGSSNPPQVFVQSLSASFGTAGDLSDLIFGTGNRTGAGTGNSGDVVVVTGDRSGAAGDSGDIILRTGTATGSRGSVIVDSPFELKTNLMPFLNDGYDLGSASLQWSDLYISDGVHIASGSGVESTTASATLNIGSSGNTSILNLGTGSNTNTINIGTGAGVTTINIGGAGDTVNIAGTLTYVNTTNLEVTDKLIVVNKNGALSSGDASGIAIEEDGYLEGYAYVGNSRASWDFVAPASEGTMRFTPPTAAWIAEFDGSGLVDGYTYTLPNASGTLLLSGQVSLVTDVVDILPMSKGGTEAALTPVEGAVVYSGATELGLTTAGTMGQPLLSSGGSGAPTWFTDTGVVKATSGALSTGNVNLTSEVTGNLPLTNGGTGTSLSAPGGSIIYGNDTALASSSIGTTGQALLSGGASTPSWFTDTGVVKATAGVLSTSNVSLTTEVSGVLPLASGGTNKNMTASAGSVVYSDADSLELTSVGTTSQFLKSNGTSAPSFDYVDRLFTTLTNNTGSTLTAGTVVILSQSTAGEIELADASTLATCEGVAGVVLNNILDGASGYVQVAGRCTPTQDAAFDLGKRVYVSETAGSSTKVAPSALNTVIFVLGYAVSTTDIILNMRLEAVN